IQIGTTIKAHLLSCSRYSAKVASCFNGLFISTYRFILCTDRNCVACIFPSKRLSKSARWWRRLVSLPSCFFISGVEVDKRRVNAYTANLHFTFPDQLFYNGRYLLWRVSCNANICRFCQQVL